MGFRFQKRIKILPGVSINLSKSGVSTSLGVKGARVTLGHGKTRTTVGLPGTGISHTTTSSVNKTPAPLLQSTEPAQVMSPALAKVGGFLYKALGWVCAAFLFLIILSIVIQYLTK